jgi:hypothetical protein
MCCTRAALAGGARTAESGMISAETACWDIDRNRQIFNEDVYLPLYLPLCDVLSKEKTTFFDIFSYVENNKDYTILFAISLTYCAILSWDFLELCCTMQQCRLCLCLQKQSNAERYIFFYCNEHYDLENLRNIIFVYCFLFTMLFTLCV